MAKCQAMQCQEDTKVLDELKLLRQDLSNLRKVTSPTSEQPAQNCSGVEGAVSKSVLDEMKQLREEVGRLQQLELF